MMGRMLLVDSESNWARSLRGVVARGYLDPDVKLATRYFIAPVGGIMLAALLVPLGLGFIVTNTFRMFHSIPPAFLVLSVDLHRSEGRLGGNNQPNLSVQLSSRICDDFHR
jgi:hypothetical protein